jgi:hypothetical protein
MSHKRTEISSPWQLYFVEGSLEVKLPTIWTDEKRRAEAERRERLEERRVE